MVTHCQQVIECKKSIYYHSKMEGYYSSIYRIFVLFTILIGTSSLWSLIDIFNAPNIPIFIGIVGSALALVNIILESQKQLSKHEQLKKRYYDILMKLYGKEFSQFSTEELNEIIVLRLFIEKDEPPTIHVLTAICRNEVIRSMFTTSRELQKYLTQIPWYKTKTYHLINWNI